MPIVIGRIRHVGGNVDSECGVQCPRPLLTSDFVYSHNLCYDLVAQDRCVVNIRCMTHVPCHPTCRSNRAQRLSRMFEQSAVLTTKTLYLPQAHFELSFPGPRLASVGRWKRDRLMSCCLRLSLSFCTTSMSQSCLLLTLILN